MEGLISKLSALRALDLDGIRIPSRRGFVFLALFSILALSSLQINIFKIEGITSKAFTLFEFFGPIAGGFLGLGGLIVVGYAKITNALITNAPFDIIEIVKLTPMMFAAYYFSKNGIKNPSGILLIAIPVIAMVAFWSHPIGSQVWYYALYWLIPIIGAIILSIPKWICEIVTNFAESAFSNPILNIMRKGWDMISLYARSLGATFTAHAVGSVLFLYTIPTVPALWLGLIPIVAIERGLFACGIAASYVVFTNALNAVDTFLDISKYVNVEKKYVLQLSGAKKEE
jgi:hypothetical protein